MLFCKFFKSRPLPAVGPITTRTNLSGRAGVTVALLLVMTGCSELQARHHARAGNGHFMSGDYAGAVREYEIAEQSYPSGLFVVQLNKGLACRQLMVPGAKGPDQDRAVDCALNAFTKTLCAPVTAGVPLITPVPAFTLKPSGRSAAP